MTEEAAEAATGGKLQVSALTVTLADGEVLELTSANPDLVRFDITRNKHKWPDAEAAPILWMTFIAWAAARRTGVYTDTWDKWSNEDCLELEVGDDEDVDPTQTGPGSDSA